MFSNPKTTLTAMITLVASAIGYWGLQVPAEVQLAIVTVGVFLIGVFAKDGARAGDKL